MTPREATARKAALAKASGQKVMLLSGVTGQGVPEVLRTLQGMIQSAPSPLGAEGWGEGMRPLQPADDAPHPDPLPKRGEEEGDHPP